MAHHASKDLHTSWWEYLCTFPIPIYRLIYTCISLRWTTEASLFSQIAGKAFWDQHRMMAHHASKDLHTSWWEYLCTFPIPIYRLIYTCISLRWTTEASLFPQISDMTFWDHRLMMAHHASKDLHTSWWDWFMNIYALFLYLYKHTHIYIYPWDGPLKLLSSLRYLTWHFEIIV